MPETLVSCPNKQDNATHQRTHVVMHGYNLDLAVSSGTLLLDLDLERDLDLDFHLDLGPPRGQPRVCIRRLPFSYKYRFTNVTKAHGIRNGWAPPPLPCAIPDRHHGDVSTDWERSVELTCESGNWGNWGN